MRIFSRTDGGLGRVCCIHRIILLYTCIVRGSARSGAAAGMFWPNLATPRTHVANGSTTAAAATGSSVGPSRLAHTRSLSRRDQQVECIIVLYSGGGLRVTALWGFEVYSPPPAGLKSVTRRLYHPFFRFNSFDHPSMLLTVVALC